MRSTALALIIAGSALASQPALADDLTANMKSGYNLFNPTPRSAMREMSTDRPDKTESAYTVDAGHYQVELDFLTSSNDRLTDVSGDIETRTLNVAPINFKVGLTNTTDVQFVFDAFVKQTVKDRSTGVSQDRDGFGDLTIRLKQNFWGNDSGRSAFALMPYVKLPTNTNQLGNNDVEAGIIAPIAFSVTERVGVGLMTQVDLLKDEVGGGYSPTYVATGTIGFDLTDRVGVFTELFSERSSDDNDPWIATFDVGTTFALTENIQLDGGVNFGLTEAAEDVDFFFGVSTRF